jgi:hypothetical protein
MPRPPTPWAVPAGRGGDAPGARFPALGALAALALAGASCGAAAAAEAVEGPAPFAVRDLNPFIQVYGLPPPDAVEVTPPGRTRLQLLLEIANSYVLRDGAEESISLDGETWRLSFSARHGFSDRVEAGLEVPIVFHGGGVLDGLIEGWHDLWGMWDGDRGASPRNQLDYGYRDGGREPIAVRSAQGGIGDVRLLAGVALFRPEDGSRELALRGSLELPTGDGSRLLGSGSVDAALSVDAVERGLASLGITGFGRLGLLASSDGDVLPERQRHLVAFGGLGLAWRAGGRVDLKAQVDGHGSFYRSELAQLGSGSLQLTVGAAIRLGTATVLDVAVGDNLFVDTVPDFLVNVAVSHRP